MLIKSIFNKEHNMKTMLKLGIACVFVASSASSVANTSTIVGVSSDTSQRQVGESTVWVPGFHTPGKAGIGAAGRGKVDLAGLSRQATQSQGVYRTNSNHNTSSYSFAQVAAQDVWFGEWSSSNTPNFANRTVFYVGDSKNSTVPQQGVATYAVKGINQFSGNNALNGTLTANFGDRTLQGQLSNSQLNIGINSRIVNTTFEGGAIANGNTTGKVQGQFFGTNAAGLAGIATFDNKTLNTAFGGQKN
jgi:hypothetical protein